MARTPIHPGEHLAEESAELARQIDVPVNRITGIINGQRAITAERHCDLATGLAPAQNFGSICRNFMSCAPVALASIDAGMMAAISKSSHNHILPRIGGD